MSSVWRISPSFQTDLMHFASLFTIKNVEIASVVKLDWQVSWRQLHCNLAFSYPQSSSSISCWYLLRLKMLSIDTLHLQLGSLLPSWNVIKIRMWLCVEIFHLNLLLNTWLHLNSCLTLINTAVCCSFPSLFETCAFPSLTLALSSKCQNSFKIIGREPIRPKRVKIKQNFSILNSAMTFFQTFIVVHNSFSLEMRNIISLWVKYDGVR